MQHHARALPCSLRAFHPAALQDDFGKSWPARVMQANHLANLAMETVLLTTSTRIATPFR